MNNDIMTLFLATSILAAGGLGLYVFNTNKDDNSEHVVSEEEETAAPEHIEEIEEPVTKTRQSKTKKSRKPIKGTKRRYY